MLDRVEQQVGAVHLNELGSAKGLGGNDAVVEQSINLTHRGWHAGAGEPGQIRDAESLVRVHEQLRQNQPLGVTSQQGR